MSESVFRYDLAGPEPRVILITELNGSRRACPRLGYVVLPFFDASHWDNVYAAMRLSTLAGPPAAYDAPWSDVYADRARATEERE